MAPPKVKYYLYISDTKVDMLFTQFPRNILKKISADLNISLRVVSVSLKEKQSEQTRFDKVSVVSNYINNHLEVGSIDSSQTYFKGKVPMRWGSFDGNFVYFAGKTDQTIFGLGGSNNHVISEQKGEALTPNSYTPYVLAALEKLDSNPEFGASEFNWSELSWRLDRLGPDKRHVVGSNLERVARATYTVLRRSLGPEEPLEFLARKLVEESTNPKKLVDGSLYSEHILLGSPIYVAYAD